MTVDVTDSASAAVAGLKTAIVSVNLAIGVAVVRLFQQHMIANRTNKQGWPSTGFWADAARSTSYNLLAEGVLVSVNKIGVRQRVEGGTIEPVNASKLAIPARAEAYGKLPGEFPGLELAFTRRGGKTTAFALVESRFQEIHFGKRRKDGTRKVERGQEHGGAVMFWLVDRVEQAPDPESIPNDSEIAETAIAEVEAAVERALRK